MVKQRIPETEHGIQGDFNVTAYDEMQRHMRTWTHCYRALLKLGMVKGHALEIGPGPGYLGIEWLKHTSGTTLTGLDISTDMIALATRNAEAHGLCKRAEYRLGSGNQLPFDDCSFDLAFTNGSLHEWAHPQQTFNEIWRILKPSGEYLISDLRRDMNWLIVRFMYFSVRPASIRHFLLTSVGAAYTPSELQQMCDDTRLKGGKVLNNPFGISLTGCKN